MANLIYKAKVFATCLTFLALSPLSGKAQEKYSTEHTSTDDFYRTNLQAALGWGYFHNHNLEFATRVETYVGNRILPQVSYTASIANGVGTLHHEKFPDAKGGRSNASNFAGGVIIFFWDKKQETELSVSMDNMRMFSHSLANIKVPGEKRYQLGAAIGLERYRIPMQLNPDEEGNAKDTLFRYKSLDDKKSFRLGYYNSSEDSTPVGSAASPYTMGYGGFVYVGLNLRTITNTVINVEEYGRRFNAEVNDVYMHLLFSTGARLSNVVDDSAREWKLSGGPGAFNKIGFRLGVNRHTNRIAGFTYGYEIGWKPGPITGTGFEGHGGFMKVNAGFILGSKRYFGERKAKNNTASPKKDDHNVI